MQKGNYINTSTCYSISSSLKEANAQCGTYDIWNPSPNLKGCTETLGSAKENQKKMDMLKVTEREYIWYTIYNNLTGQEADKILKNYKFNFTNKFKDGNIQYSRDYYILQKIKVLLD